jgi:hypothetical protein
MHWLLYPQGKSPWYLWHRRLGGPQSRSGHSSGGKNCQPLPGLEPPITQPIAQCYTTELSQIFHVGTGDKTIDENFWLELTCLHSSKCFCLHDEASKNCKLLIIQFIDPFLWIVSTGTDFYYVKFSRFNLSPCGNQGKE